MGVEIAPNTTPLWPVRLCVFTQGPFPPPPNQPHPPARNPAVRDALNATGRRILYTIHGSAAPGSDFGSVANMWRTGDDLYSSSFAMWTSRLDLATTPFQRSLAGPGSLPDPDFLEVGYSPRCTRATSQSPLEQRSMFTLWAALPTGLTLSADLREGSGGLDAFALATLTNAEVIAVNQDPLVAPMAPVRNASGLQTWVKPLAAPGAAALVLFHRGAEAGPLPPVPAVREVGVLWGEVGWPAGARVAVRDLWAGADLGVFVAGFAANITQREARIYTLRLQG